MCPPAGDNLNPRYDEARCAKCGQVKCYRLLVLVENRWVCANCADTRRRPSTKRRARNVATGQTPYAERRRE
jgi:hypothetical protein